MDKERHHIVSCYVCKKYFKTENKYKSNEVHKLCLVCPDNLCRQWTGMYAVSEDELYHGLVTHFQKDPETSFAICKDKDKGKDFLLMEYLYPPSQPQ